MRIATAQEPHIAEKKYTRKKHLPLFPVDTKGK